MKNEVIYKVGDKKIEVTHPDRIIFPKSQLTKKDLVGYYAGIAQLQFPYAKDRLITMHRFPDGIDHEGFYHKDAPDYFPAWIKRKDVEKKDGGSVHYVICSHQATLTYLAQQLCITPHLWLSRADKLKQPDRLIFDLDPEKQSFNVVCSIAKKIKELLDSCGLISFVMTTGSKGLHVVVPLRRASSFDQVRHFAQLLARYITTIDDRTTMEIRKEKREGKLFIDTLRNAFGATSVAPYAVRAHEYAPIATPLRWDELDEPTLRSDFYTITSLAVRLQKVGDVWHDFADYKGSVATAQKIFSKNF